MESKYLTNVSAFMVFSATVIASCNDPWKAWEQQGNGLQQPPKPCCPALQSPWNCKIFTNSSALGDKCFSYGVCALSQVDAVTQTDNNLMPGTKAAQTSPTVCTLSWCDTRGQPYAEPQGNPVCTVIELDDAGAPTGSCIAGSDACTGCFNSYCCAEYAACAAAEGDAVCQADVGYWLGTNPAPTVNSTAVNDLNNCVTTNCGEASVCTAYLKLPPQQPDAGP